MRNARKRLCVALLSLLLLFLCFALPVLAEEETEALPTEEMPPEFSDLLDALPEELRALLPDGIFSSDSAEVGGAVQEMGNLSYLLNTLLSLVGLRLGDALGVLAAVCGLLLLSSVLRNMRSALGGDGIGRAFAFCSTLVITLTLLRESYVSLGGVVDYFTTVSRVTRAVIPLLGVLYAMGGNVSAAVASSGGLAVYMTVLEELVGKSVVPFCGICMALALIHALDPSLRTGMLSSTLKKNYTTALGFLMMLLLAMLAAQTTLGASSDTLAMRSVKFAAGNLIPVVGGSVSELLRTVSAGVGYLRGTVGVCGTLLIALTLLPTLLELLLLRAVWQLAASLAELLGCDGEKKLLEEFASLLGYLIAAVSICSSVLLLALTLLTHCASAIG